MRAAAQPSLCCTSFFSPVSLFHKIVEIANPFLESMDQQLIRQLQNARHREPFGHMEPIDVALSFKTLLNGVLVELLHSGRRGHFTIIIFKGERSS
ncbi:hypothetical protein ACFQ5D_12760 [Paenibacillus farraposensis]|uniref:Uncharacterized protein n=1 Tax=Paenibacillus farraposensis TaxID=2807095 RepID=A0ABW4DDX6_9BACL|nr:hypothetical protein [Paenibacillus farraposensis]MCC3379397.1 hypothetical protein [Paenibacillus farraposensis]